MTKIETFQTLYGFDTNGKLKQWDIHVKDYSSYSEVVYSHGMVDGKATTNTLRVDKGKNIGKKNETTHFQQAVLFAQSKWNKKRDTDGYTTTREPNAQILFPMLAQEYKKNIKKVVFPLYVQPKLDGYRMIYDPATKKMTTRTGREYTILRETALYSELKKVTKLSLDGELYVHDKNFVFEDYGILRKQKTSILNLNDLQKLEKIEYHVYDLIDTEKSFSERIKILEKLFNEQKFSKIKLVPTFICECDSQITSQHLHFTKDGYEGTMVRNGKGMYRCKYRSYDLLKYKDFDDAEFKIIDIASETDTSGSSVFEPLVVWVCETNGDKGIRFNVRPQGTESERKYLYKHGFDFIGKKLWVKFQGYTDNGVVRFPSTMRGTYKEYIRGLVE